MPNDRNKGRAHRTTGDEKLDRLFEAAQHTRMTSTRVNLKDNGDKNKDTPAPPDLTEEEVRLYRDDPGELGVRWLNRDRKEMGLPELSDSEKQDIHQIWSQMITQERQTNAEKRQR